MQKRVAIVTGASRGIGAAIASQLHAHGYTTYGTSRSSAAGPPGVLMLVLDVASPASVRACVASLLAHEGRVDLLVNNAGYPMTGAVEEVTIEEEQRQFDTNYFGALRMMQAVLPTMRAQRTGHIINVSSAAADVPVPFYGAYGASKSALERASLSLRAEVRPFGIRVACITPSSVRTNVEHVLPAHALPEYAAARSKLISAMEETVRHGATPDRVARVALRVALAKAPRAQYRVGGDSRIFGLFLRLFPMKLLEFLVRQRFGLAASGGGRQPGHGEG